MNRNSLVLVNIPKIESIRRKYNFCLYTMNTSRHLTLLNESFYCQLVNIPVSQSLFYGNSNFTNGLTAYKTAEKSTNLRRNEQRKKTTFKTVEKRKGK